MLVSRVGGDSPVVPKGDGTSRIVPAQAADVVESQKVPDGDGGSCSAPAAAEPVSALLPPGACS